MEHAPLQHAFGHEPVSARGEQVVGHEAAARLQVGEQRRLLADAVEILDLQVHARLLGNGQQVEHAVGRSAGGEHRGDGVFKGLPRHDVPGADVPSHQFHDLATAFAAHLRLVGMGGGHARAADGRDAEHFEGDGHGIGRELAAAGPRAGTGVVFHVLQLQVGHPARGVGADGLEDVLDRHVVLLEAAGHDRTAVEHEGRHVDAAEGHDRARNRLVASGEGDEPVEHVPDRDQFDGIGDHLAAHQRRLHALAAHGDPVGNRHRVEFHGRAAGFADAFLHVFGQIAEVVGAGADLDPGIGDPDDRTGKVRVGEPRSLEHGPGRGPRGSVGDGPAVSLSIVSHVSVSVLRGWFFFKGPSRPGRTGRGRAEQACYLSVSMKAVNWATCSSLR